MPLPSLPSTIASEAAFWLEPNGTPRDRNPQVRGDSMSLKHGSKKVVTQPVLPTDIKQFEYVCTSFAEIEELEDFFLARAGQVHPFWMPSWQDELTYLGEQSSVHGNTLLKFKEIGLIDTFMPLGNQYRYVLIQRNDTGQWYIAYLLLPDDDPSDPSYVSGGIEYLRISYVGGDGGALTDPTKARPRWLRFVRFATDDLPIEYQVRGGAIIKFPVIDLPREVP